jgi:hypothetical protein
LHFSEFLWMLVVIHSLPELQLSLYLVILVEIIQIQQLFFTFLLEHFQQIMSLIYISV